MDWGPPPPGYLRLKQPRILTADKLLRMSLLAPPRQLRALLAGGPPGASRPVVRSLSVEHASGIMSNIWS